MKRYVLVVVLALMGLGAQEAQAQTTGQRFALEGGLGIGPYQWDVGVGAYAGGRAWLGRRRLFVFGTVDAPPAPGLHSAPNASFGVGAVTQRSERWRLQGRVGFTIYGDAIVGAGVEYGGASGVSAAWEGIARGGGGLSLLRIGGYTGW